VDEAALPEVARAVDPRGLLLLNLFRDQLDRYGEVATVARFWSSSLAALSKPSVVVANADDPLVAAVARSSPTPPVHFGIETAERSAQEREHASDVKACPLCGSQIRYSATFLGHLGHYACESCDFRRLKPTTVARDVRLRGVDGTSFTLANGGEEVSVELPLPGTYNVYNAIGASAMALALGASLSECATALATVTPAFGRMEHIETADRHIYLALAKNPTGLNEILRTLIQTDEELHLLAMLNDNTADGHDVSWIWDADIEMLRGRVASVVFGGVRAEDLALRFKYAGVTTSSAAPQWAVERQSEPAFKRALEWTPASRRLFIVPTYTAMLEIRQELTRLGMVRPYWEE